MPSNNAQSDLLDRMPPQSLEAEEAVIGSILTLPACLDEISAAVALKATDFYDDQLRLIFSHMANLYSQGKKIDPMLLQASLKAADDYERVGGASTIGRCVQSVPSAAHAVYYAGIVKKHYRARSVIECGTQMIQDGYKLDGDGDDAIAAAEKQLQRVADDQPSRLANITDILHDAIDRLEVRMTGEYTRGVSTGFDNLDAKTNGLTNSELTILACRPGMGKTSLGLQIAAQVANSEPVLMISLEMTHEELGDRLLSAFSMVNGFAMRNGTLSKADRQSVIAAATRVSELNLAVEDSRLKTMPRIASDCRRAKRMLKGLSLVVIDYLQLIKPVARRNNRQEEVAEISRDLKLLAGEMNVPVICLAQLNRSVEDKQDKRPLLSSLRESGSLEQDADNVWFVHRAEYYDSKDPELKGKATIIIAKQRSGPLGDVSMIFREEYCLFQEPSGPQYPIF